MNHYAICFVLIFFFAECTGENNSSLRDRTITNAKPDQIINTTLNEKSAKEDSLFSNLENSLIKNPESGFSLLKNYFIRIKSLHLESVFSHLALVDSLSTKSIATKIFTFGGVATSIYLCTFSDSFSLVDSKYLGKTTMFDHGHSENISYQIQGQNKLLVSETYYGYKKNDAGAAVDEIDTTYFRKYILEIFSNGKISKVISLRKR